MPRYFETCDKEKDSLGGHILTPSKFDLRAILLRVVVYRGVSWDMGHGLWVMGDGDKLSASKGYTHKALSKCEVFVVDCHANSRHF